MAEKYKGIFIYIPEGGAQNTGDYCQTIRARYSKSGKTAKCAERLRKDHDRAGIGRNLLKITKKSKDCR